MIQCFNQEQVAALIEAAVAPLHAKIARLESQVAGLQTEVDRLQRENARLKKNSSTSSKPPSSDLVKPPPPSVQGGKRGSSDSRMRGPSARDLLRHDSGVQWYLWRASDPWYIGCAGEKRSRALLTTQPDKGSPGRGSAHGTSGPWPPTRLGAFLFFTPWDTPAMPRKTLRRSRIAATTYVRAPFRRMNLV